MRLAVIADIHGNADALAAVLADVAGFAPDAMVNLGDCFSGPLDAGRTADLLAGAGIAATVRGNHDRWLLDAALMDDWDRAALPLLTPATMDWLAGLPATAVIDDVFLCHATPQDDLGYWVEARTADGTRCLAGLEAIAGRAEGITQSLMLCGHTHVARVARLADGRVVANPGSVGCPGFRDAGQARPFSVGTPFAAYAIFDRIGPTWAVTHRHVPYDTRPAVARAQAAGWDDWASALATGWL
jgi:diadenosine tetraphosphatase ApaH/serine/threonine PP2A family protein phosphatase